MGHFCLQDLFIKDSLVMESVHGLPRENTDPAGKPRNSYICKDTHTMVKRLFKISKNNKTMLQFIIREILMR